MTSMDFVNSENTAEKNTLKKSALITKLVTTEKNAIKDIQNPVKDSVQIVVGLKTAAPISILKGLI